MKKLVLLGIMISVITGCMMHKEKTIYSHTTFLNYFREKGGGGTCYNDSEINVFFFDVDGDGVDEAFVAYEIHQMGNNWQMWHCQGGKWQQAGTDDVVIFAHPQNFYYRDDVRQQPRLFVETCREGTPASISCAKDKSMVVTPFDKEERWGDKRIWSYWHMSANSGYISFVHFARDGECAQSPAWEIYTGDGGTEIGNGIYDAVFNKETLLPTRLISPATLLD